MTAAALAEVGYTLLPSLHPAHEVERLHAAIAEVYEGLGAPETHAVPPQHPAPDVEISVVGLVMHQLGKHCGALADVLLRPEAVAVAEQALGPGMFLEYSAAVVNRGERPFFPWHMHVGGVDNVKYRKEGLFPRFERLERLTMLTYLTDLEPEQGELLVFPRRIEDPQEAPHPPNEASWPGSARLACRRGSVALLDQSTWHAALPKASPGLRVFIACYFAAAHATPTSWVDRSWEGLAAEGSLLASTLKGQPST